MSLRGWIPHGVCVALIGLFTLLWSLGHQSDAELQAQAWDPDAPAAERVAAMRKLTTRPSATGEQAGRLRAEALASSDPKLRLLAAGSDLLRFGAGERLGPPPTPPSDTEAHLAQIARFESTDWLWFIVYRRKVGGMQIGARRRLDLQETAWTLGALEGQAPPNEDARRHVIQRAQAGMRRPR